MAKMMKKWMALALALSLMAHVIPLPAAADDTASPDVQTVTVDLTNGDGQKIGEKTTTTTTDTQDSSSIYQQNVKEESNWNSQDTTNTSSDPVQNGNVTTEVSGSVTTDVTGEETAHDNMTSDKTTGVQVLYGDANGTETTIVTDTTVTVTTTTDTVVSQETDGPTNIISDEVKNGPWTPVEQTSEGTWVENGFTDGEYKQSSGVTTTNHGQTAIDVDEDPLEDQDVTLTMTQKDTTDSEKLYISLADALANDISYTDGQVLADGSVVTFNKDADGNLLGYTIRKITPTGSTTSAIITGAEGGLAPNGREIVTYVKPEGYTEGTEDVLDAQGKVIGTITTEAITDENGNVIGYTITQVTDVPSGSLPGVSTENLTAPADTWVLPAKPVPSAPVTNHGLTTTQTVEELYDANGTLVGYETITLITDEDGNEQSRESVKVYGTKTTYSSTLEKRPESDNVTTTTVTTVLGTHTTQNYTKTSTGSSTTVNTRVLTDEIYELVNTEDGMFLLLEGKVYEVKAMDGHGTTQMTTLQPNMSLDPTKHGYINTTTDLRGAQEFSVTTPRDNTYDAQYVGYGLESRINVKHGSDETIPHQFALKDSNGNVHYVYCVDLNTSAVRGTNYNMVNVKDSGYFTESVAQKVEAIAITGFWGTKSGTGSLDNLKAYMKANKSLHNLSDTEIDQITEGMALTATQAALWRYGHSASSSNPMGANVVGTVYSNSWDKNEVRKAYDDEKKLVNAVYTALVNMNMSNVSNNTTELLNTENFATETSLTIKEKATNSDGTVKTKTDKDGNSHEVYVTDVAFTVNVKESDLTGNLVVTLTDELGNTLATRQLATENSNFLGKMLTKNKVGDDSVEFLIEDVELAEGVKVNLNLSGTQNLEEGAYLYTAAVYTNSQTFIGVASGTQQVNLNVQMKFDVTDPKAAIKHTTKTWNEKETDVTHYIKTDSYSRERTGTVTDVVQTVNTEVYGTLVQTDVATATTKTTRDWSENYRYELVTINDEDGGDENDEEEILEEDVPLADAPKTGDLSVYWLLMALICLAGAAMLSRKKTAR